MTRADDEERLEILRMFDSGMSSYQIAAVTGRSASGLRAMRKRIMKALEESDDV